MADQSVSLQGKNMKYILIYEIFMKTYKKYVKYREYKHELNRSMRMQ